MKNRLLTLILISAFALQFAVAEAAQTKTLKLTEKNIDKIVAAMTLEEKANIVVGMSRSLTDAETADIGYTKKICLGLQEPLILFRVWVLPLWFSLTDLPV